MQARRWNGGNNLLADSKAAIIDEAKRIDEDTTHSYKGHYEAATAWRRVNLSVGLAGALAGALAAVFTLSPLNWLVVLLAVLVSASSAVMAFLNPSRTAELHQRAGAEYSALRNRARIFHTVDCRRSAAEEELATHLKAISEQRNELNQRSLQIPRWAYKRALKGVKQGEATYAVD